MNLLHFDLAVLGISVIAAGFGSLLGLGGGIIIIPVLTLLFHVDIRYADRRLDHFGDCDLERRRRCLCKGAHDPFASGNGARLATSAGALTGA